MFDNPNSKGLDKIFGLLLGDWQRMVWRKNTEK